MVIALVENAEEVELLEKHMRQENVLWIALEPFCIPKLEREGHQYKIVEDFFDKKEFFEKVALVSEEKIKDLSEFTQQWVKKKFPRWADVQLPFLEYSYYYLTILFDGIFSRVFILNKILAALGPKEAFICKRKNLESRSLQFPWSTYESVWADCAEMMQDRKKCVWHVVEYGEAKDSSVVEKSSLKKTIRNFLPGFYNILRTIKREGLKEGIRFPKTKKLVALDSGFQWPFTEALFKERGYRLFFLNKDINPYHFEESNHDHLGEIDTGNLLDYQGIKISPLAKHHLNQIIGLALKKMHKDYKRAIRLFKKIKPSAVLFSVVTTPEKWVVLQAARWLKIPLFCWGHGASGQAKYTKQKTNELLVCDFYLTQGEGSQTTYNRYKSFHFVPIPTGFPTLDRLSEMMKKNRFQPKYDFIYVTTNYYQNRFHLSFYPGIFDNELFLVQRKIIDFLKEQNLRSLLKIVPTSSFKPFFYSQFKNSNIAVEHRKSFTELLPLAKAVIIDAPTTVLLEALTTKIPIFVLTKFIRLIPQADDLLQRRAECCADEEALINALKSYIHREIYKPDVNNKDYLRAFGTYTNDGRSTERGVQNILDHISH
jgi:hypothetical protein